ncbi:MAG TPA: DUF3237 domain-containing protein [Hyphomicrobiales bacterium]|nr:DUF3237 domain-containing protein [Hyphomicrobiales bacterium]
MAIKEPGLEHFCDLTVELAPIMELGPGRAGQRRIIPIVGGTVRGGRISGRVLNVGADWQTVFADGMAELDTRYGIETDDGAVIEIRNFGYRHGPKEIMAAVAAGEDIDPAHYYMRTHARLETGDPRYDWVNRALFIGSGGRRKSSVEITLYRIL